MSIQSGIAPSEPSSASRGGSIFGGTGTVADEAPRDLGAIALGLLDRAHRLFRAVYVIGGLAAVLAVIVPSQMIAMRLKLKAAETIPLGFHRSILFLLGIRVTTIGAPSEDGPTLLVANHASYIDIPIIGSYGKMSFIAKSEVEDWPVMGFLCKLQRTVFVERGRRSRTLHHRNLIQERLLAGDRLILFPEGTSSDGNRVLAFKSALMSVADVEVTMPDGTVAKPAIQPMSVAYTRLHGMPLGRERRTFFAWYGDMDMLPHLLDLVAIGPLDVTVEFHAPVKADGFSSRKALTHHCERVVAAGVASALANPGVYSDDAAGSR